MENRKFYAHVASTDACNNETEKMMVRVSNAARISTAKNMNRYGSWYSTQEDFEDAASDASLSALTHVNLDGAAISYANACGLSSAVKASQRAEKFHTTTSRMDRMDEDGEWMAEGTSMRFASDSFADSDLFSGEESEDARIRWQILLDCIGELSETDQAMVMMMRSNCAYKEIASKLGCSEGAIQKRAYDIRKRMRKGMRSRGYYDHL